MSDLKLMTAEEYEQAHDRARGFEKRTIDTLRYYERNADRLGGRSGDDGSRPHPRPGGQGMSDSNDGPDDEPPYLGAGCWPPPPPPARVSDELARHYATRTSPWVCNKSEAAIQSLALDLLDSRGEVERLRSAIRDAATAFRIVGNHHTADAIAALAFPTIDTEETIDE